MLSTIDHPRPRLVGNVTDLFDIDQAHVWVGRRFEQQKPGVVSERLAHLLRAGEVREADPDPEPGEPLGQKGVGAAVEGRVGEDLVAGLGEGPDQGGDGAHSGGDGQGRLAPLKVRQLALQHAGGRITDTGVDIPRFLAQEAPLPLGDRFEGVGGVEIERGVVGG